MNELNEKSKPKAGKRRVVGILIAVAIVFGSLSIRVGPQVILMEEKAKLQNEAEQVQTGEVGYYTEYSVYPVTSDNATLIRRLESDNPRHIAFLSFKANDENAKGELLDPWGTPLQLCVTQDGMLRVSSAGPDKIFGTADDISGEFATDDFVVMRPPSSSK